MFDFQQRVFRGLQGDFVQRHMARVDIDPATVAAGSSGAAEQEVHLLKNNPLAPTAKT